MYQPYYGTVFPWMGQKNSARLILLYGALWGECGPRIALVERSSQGLVRLSMAIRDLIT